jgi:hypothetical protein
MGVAPTSVLAAITTATENVARVRAAGVLGPQSVALAQNFPNPARSITSIRFLLPMSEPVNLEVYDVQGRRVASLLDHELRPAGEQEVPVRTEGWSAGRYFYRLEAGGRSETRKMLVVK